MKWEALIVAQTSYEQWDQLPLAAQAARALADDFRKHGYTVKQPDLLDGSDKPRVEQMLVDWFGSVPEDARVVFFWTGHGTSEGKHYLVCRNSPRTGVSSFTAIDAGALGPVVANCKAEKVLLILDTCYSGHGAADIASAFSKVLATRAQIAGQERAIAVIASAHPLEKAQEGMFCRALRSVLFDASAPRSWADEDECIHSEFLARSVGKILPSDVSRPQYKADGIGQDFLPNPRYRPGQPAEFVEGRAWRLAGSTGAEHFNLATRGIEVGESGWYFAGRKPLLRALVAWLESARRGLRIVTGPPGAGKSAVMGRLATLSDPEYRKAALKAGVMSVVDEGAVPPEGIIDVAIHAKGKTFDDCARALAQALALPTGNEVAVDVEALVAAIGKIDRRLTIMIDGLDEAASGQAQIIAVRLIVPLGRLERVRVLVGSRRSVDGAMAPDGEERHGRLRAVFGADAIIDDLEDEQETHADIAEYVRLRLAASPKHRSNPDGIAAAAERVASRAEGVFLYARIVSRTLQEIDRLDRELPSTALEAFAHDLQSRFGAEEQRVDDLLAALAWGEGKGLTRRVWPLVANAFARHSRPYEDEDVAWVLGHAGWHIVETGEDGQAVYRLGHQALADHYRSRREVKEAQNSIVGTLTAGIEGAAWLDCDRYLWRHLADHATQAGRLDALIRDPGYLAVAEPARLVMALPGIHDQKGRRFADIYNRVVDRLIDQPPLERLPLIHLTAQMEAPDLAPQFEPPVPTRWRCRWARVQPSTPHRIIGRHLDGVTAIAFGEVDGRAVVVSGSVSGEIRMLDARTGRAIGKPLKGRTEWIHAVALNAVEGRTVVSGSSDGTIRRWDARSGKRIIELLKGHSWINAFTKISARCVIALAKLFLTRRITAAALALVEGREIAASGNSAGTIRLWDVETEETIGQPLKGQTDEVTAIAIGVVEGRVVVASGSWDGTIQLWDTRTGEPTVYPLMGHQRWFYGGKNLAGSVSAIAIGEVDGRAVVVSGSESGEIRMLDARTGQPIGELFKGHLNAINAIVLGAADGRAIVVSGSRDQTVRLWDARTGQPIGAPLEGHASPVNAVALGEVGGVPVVASGSFDKTIRLWDARGGQAIATPHKAHTETVSDIAVLDDRAIVVSGGRDCTVRLWDACTGEPIGKPLEGHTSWVDAVAVGSVEGRAVVISNANAAVLLWDARTGEPIGKSLTFTHERAIFGGMSVGRQIVRLGAVDGRAVAVSVEDDGAIRRWDAHTGESIGEPLKGHATLVRHVAIGPVDDRTLLVSGSEDGAIRRWDARSGQPIGKPLKGHTTWISAIALGVLDGRAVVVAGSADKTIRLWDARTGEPIGTPLKSEAWINSVGLLELEGRPVVVSAEDHTIRLWDARTYLPWFVINLASKTKSLAHKADLGTVVDLDRGLLVLEWRRGDDNRRST